MRRALKRHLDAFNNLRDTHVQMRLVARWRKRVPGADAFYSHLFLLEKRSVKETYRELRHIRTRRMARWIAASRRDIREHHSDLRAERANKRLLIRLRDAFSRVLQARRRITRRDPASIHRTRVAFKKFRYMAEAMRVLLPSMSRRRLDAFRRYQAMMGDVQDARLLLAALEGFVRDEGLDPKEFRALRSRIARRMSMKVTAYLKSADTLERFSPAFSQSLLP
jgi:CHAD domain-containing protein